MDIENLFKKLETLNYEDGEKLLFENGYSLDNTCGEFRDEYGQVVNEEVENGKAIYDTYFRKIDENDEKSVISYVSICQILKVRKGDENDVKIIKEYWEILD